MSEQSHDSRDGAKDGSPVIGACESTKSMTERANNRREYDAELGQLKGEVGAIHADIAWFRTWAQEISDELRSMRTRPPSYAFLAGAAGLLAVMLTIMTLVVTPIGKTADISADLLAGHLKDGHPDSVLSRVEALDERVSGLLTNIYVDLAEHDESLQDLEERMARLETLAAERTMRFKRALEKIEEDIQDLRGNGQ